VVTLLFFCFLSSEFERTDLFVCWTLFTSVRYRGKTVHVVVGVLVFASRSADSRQRTADDNALARTTFERRS
jgi:hypothetical protein